MKQLLFSLMLLGCISFNGMHAQDLKLKKGIITDSLSINDSIPESFALYLPSSFNGSSKWPIIFVFDLEGNTKRVLRLFKVAAEKNNYLLAASNNVSDSLSIAQNILIASRMINKVASMLPINNDRVYTAGFSSGAKIAALAPTFIKQIDGVISLGSAVPNTEILTTRNSFHFIGIVGKEDFNYTNMLEGKQALNKIKFPNNLLVFDGGHQWPDQLYLEKAMEIFSLSAMAKGNIGKDENFINTSLKQNLQKVNSLISEKQMLNAYERLVEIIKIYRSHINVDSLVNRRKELKKDKTYRAQRRAENLVLFNESFIRDDYNFNLTEDITTLNYNNLGWWNYQMGELREYQNKAKLVEKQMGKRLIGYLNALVEDNIDIELTESIIDEEAVLFLWMLKTITDPQNYQYYLNIISVSAKNEDFGTALFYLEELLKNGYKNKTELYAVEHTALLRITPEFNKIVDEYLKDARYEIIEE
ncbi:alpha/beta hydrolase [Muriicola sp. Z0-33]|uniref:alpha/beta hydrolase n=1 Tax=Muriicola sp. Z0-33 TaxID=2816957 RepID=UPI002236F8EB|nr:alpha/beta hydrolase [Muriicola sp. Z0-33]MCW5517587.1 alpha/beta hydrolase [Muriicola sp. Z0-33]